MNDTDLSVLQQRATAGDVSAQRELGGRMLLGRDAPFLPSKGAQLIADAAAQNDPASLQLLAVLTSLGIGRPRNWREAHAYVVRAAEIGDARAQGQIAVLGGVAEFDPLTWLTPPTAQARSNAPRIATFDALLPPAACAWIIERARPELDVARVKNPERGGANANGYRSNTGMGFSVLDTDLVLQIAHARIVAATGLPVTHQEPTNILRYEPGQEYRPHFDFLDPGAAHFALELQQTGQRLLTFLIYLNDDYDGGETEFPRLNWRYKGKSGDALMFWNVTPEGGPDLLTLHAGTPTTKGVKWLFSKWVRDRPLPLV